MDSPREGLGPHRTKGRLSSSKIRLANLPPEVAASLSALDIDGDGILDADELQNYHEDAQRTLSRSKYYRKLLMVLSVVFLAHLGASTGVLVGVVNLAKESHVSAGAAMTTRDGSAIVSTASYSNAMPMSSVLPDAAFEALTKFSLTNPSTGSYLSMLVLGWARINGEGAFGSTVRIMTFAGTITLDGRSMSFSDAVAPVFEEAGFTVTPLTASRRRLLDIGTSLVGFFNYLATFDLDALEAAALATPGSAAPTPFVFPAAYSMQVSVYTPCNYTGDASWCSSFTAALATVAHPDFPGAYFFMESSSVTASLAGSKSVSTFSYDFERQDTTVVDLVEGVKTTGSVVNRFSSPAVWANCEVTPVAAEATIFDYIQQRGIPPVFVGFASVLNATARHFKFASNDSGISIDYYDAEASHVPVRLVLNVPLAPMVVIDIAQFTALAATSAPVTWPGPASDPFAPGYFGDVCGPAATVPAGAALYPGAPPLGYTTSLMPPTYVSSTTSVRRRQLLTTQPSEGSPGSARRSLQQYTPPRPPRPPPAPPPSPRPPLPAPPPPCPNPSYSAWLVCSITTQLCSTVYMNTCQNATTVWTSDSRSATSTYTAVPSPAGRRLQQAPSATFFLGAMLATFSTLDGSFTVTTDTVQVDLSWTTWPASAQSQCVAAYSLSTCQGIAANLGGYGNGLVDLNAVFGVMSLPYARAVAGGALQYSNNTYVGLSGGLRTSIMPPIPGQPLNVSQFPAINTAGFVARVWYFLDGDYKQNMFVWIHVSVPLPCAGGSTNCGALSFDVVNDDVFLIPLNVSGSTPRSGAWSSVGCYTTPSGQAPSLPTGLGAFNNYADCVNVGDLANLVFLGMTVCGSHDFACRSCYGCTQAQVDSGSCLYPPNPILSVATTCDPMGAVGASAIYAWKPLQASPPPPVAPPPALPPPAPTQFARSLAGTDSSWYPAGTFFLDPAVGGSADGSIPSIKGLVWTNLNCAWAYQCTSGTSGCMPCTGPYVSSNSETAALANVGACQSVAATYGYDTVWTSGYHYRSSCGVWSIDCWACKSCAYYAGGAVPPTAACNFNGGSRTPCPPLGCDSCNNSIGQQQTAMQIYKKLPAGAAVAPALPGSAPAPTPSPASNVPKPVFPLKGGFLG